MRVLYLGRIGIQSDGSYGGTKTGKKRQSEQGGYIQETQPKYGTGLESNPGYIGERRALSPVCHPCSLIHIVMLLLCRHVRMFTLQTRPFYVIIFSCCYVAVMLLLC